MEDTSLGTIILLLLLGAEFIIFASRYQRIVTLMHSRLIAAIFVTIIVILITGTAAWALTRGGFLQLW